MNPSTELERRHRGRIVRRDDVEWRVGTVFEARNDGERATRCAASGRSIAPGDRHLLVGAVRVHYSYDYDHRTAFVVADGDELAAWVDAGPSETGERDGTGARAGG